MAEYAVFGGTLRSNVEFPELRPAISTTPDWTLEHTDSHPPADGSLVALGEEILDDASSVQLLRTGAGLSLRFSDSGRFDLRDEGRHITWYPAPAADIATVRSDVLGRVFACALHEQGAYVGHASAVSYGSGAIGFMAAKGTGKSTLALALVQGGARLLTDDTLAIVVSDERALARPGVHSVRLWEDSAAAVAVGAQLSVSASGKLEARSLEHDRLMNKIVPLAALYILTPVEGAQQVTRSDLSPIHAAMMLVQHSRLGPLLGGTEGPTLLRRAVALTRHVPVRLLGVPRTLDRLPEVVEQLRAWHVQ